MIDKDDLKIRRHLKRFIPMRLAELGMTVPDLHRATGDSRTQCRRVAEGAHTPSLAFAGRIAVALQCSIDEVHGHAVLVTSE